jgi:hypothetical protein
MFSHDGSTSVNLIPNGDFSSRLSTWAGTGLPVGASAGSTITSQPGGLSGTYLNINQAATTSNTVRFRSVSLPTPGRLTGVIVLRNADAGSKTMTLSFAGLANPTCVISDSEWTIATCTPTDILSASATYDLSIYTNDATAFNVDVAYVGWTYGQGGALLVPASRFRTIEHIETWDAPSLTINTQTTQTFTITGAVNGDFVLASYNGDLAGIDVSAYVNSADTVTLKLRNDTGGTVDLGSSSWRFRVWKRAYV